MPDRALQVLEEFRRLDVRKCMRQIRESAHRQSLQAMIVGRTWGFLTVALCPGETALLLTYPSGAKATIGLQMRPMPYGGRRAFVVCAACTATCEILYEAEGQWICRGCTGGGYASQRLSPPWRLLHRMRVLQRQIVGHGLGRVNLDGVAPRRRAGRHRRKYAAQRARWEAAHDAYWEDFRVALTRRASKRTGRGYTAPSPDLRLVQP
jgi:hypothetical protein